MKFLTFERAKQKLALFLTINSAGHTQALLAIANQLRDDHNIRCVFLVAGPPHNRTIEDNGHELIELEDRAEPYSDFEIEPDEDLSRPMDEAAVEARLKEGKKRRSFRGAQRWPQFIARNQCLFRVPPEQSNLGLAKFMEQVALYTYGNCKQIDEAIELINPDIIIGDLMLVQPAVLKKEQTRPWIRVYSPNPIKIFQTKLPNSITPPQFVGCKLFTKAQREQMRREQPESWQALLDNWRRESVKQCRIFDELWRQMSQFYIDNGCGDRLARCTDSAKVRIDSPHLNIYMFPETIDYDQDDDMFERPPSWLRCDSLIRKATGRNESIEHEQWIKRIEEKKKEGFTSFVYFSLGSIASGEPGIMQRYIDYLSSDHSKRFYIISLGVNGDKLKLDAKNMLGGNYLPQTLLLQQVSLAIIHGGNNSITEALYYGKPMIILPGFADQFDNAQRIEDLGLGKRLDLYNCNRDELLQSIDELTSSQELVSRLTTIGVQMRARDELGKVSRIIWDLMEKTKPREDSSR